MFDLERWQEIFDTIRKNRLRTFLTGVSVSSGIFILVILLGFGNGMRNGIAEEFKGDAATSIWVWPGRTSLAHNGLNPNRRIQFRNADLDYVHENLDDDFDRASTFFFPPNTQLLYKNDPIVYEVIGTTADLQDIENEFMSEGRYLNQSDMDSLAKVAIISNKIKREIFSEVETPIGEHISISGVIFTIVGVYGERGTSESEEERIFIPLSTAQLAYNGGDRIRNLTFLLPDKGNLDETVAASKSFIANLKDYLYQVHEISPDDERAIYFGNDIEQASRFYSLMDNIKLFFWFVGICTIIAGVVGVSNIMLIVVKERTREIGIRKAMGARPISIVGMILQEAIFVTAISGFTGFILSMGLLEFLGPQIEIDYVKNPSVDFTLAITMVTVLILAGALAGFFPAWRAAHIHTIDALRDE